MMNRIAKAFEHHKALIPFITCGDPDLETTERLVRAMVEAGADLVELGLPFSDPTAEGPVIQAADDRALKNGMTTEKAFGLVKRLRETIDVPIVFMTYANVVYSYGIEEFMRESEEAGADGLILPDVPYEEAPEFSEAAGNHGLALISMVAPTSDERIARIASEAEGFLYIVSSLGVTGVRSKISTDIGSLVRKIREVTDLPCAVGFGISSSAQAQDMAALSDGAIVGSAIVRKIGEKGKDGVEDVASFVRELAEAVHQA